MAPGETVRKIEKSWSIDTENREKNCKWNISVIDESGKVKNRIQTRKNFAEINDSLRRIILKGRAANIHDGGTERPETFVLDGAIEERIIQLELLVI